MPIVAARELTKAFVGVGPVQAVAKVVAQSLGLMALAAIAITIISCAVFYVGLRRYESGSALPINV